MWEHAYTPVWVCSKYIGTPEGQEKGVGFPGAGVRSGYVCWEPNTKFLEDYLVFTDETYLQPQHMKISYGHNSFQFSYLVSPSIVKLAELLLLL